RAGLRADHPSVAAAADVGERAGGVRLLPRARRAPRVGRRGSGRPHLVRGPDRRDHCVPRLRSRGLRAAVDALLLTAMSSRHSLGCTGDRPGRTPMLLQRKTAVVYGGGGFVGGAIARAFAREGATVHLAGRTAATLQVVANEIAAAGGQAYVAVVDALNQAEVEGHAAAVVERSGTLDI